MLLQWFFWIRGIGDLFIKLVEIRKYSVTFGIIALELSLILLVAAARVERDSSAMSIIKNRIGHHMRDEQLNYCFVTIIESDIFIDIENEKTI